MATPATSSSAAGTITLVVGNVRIVGIDGVARVAKVGDKVFAREVIETGADGIIQVQLDGGRFLDLGRDSKLALSSEILAEAGAAGVPGVAPVATPPTGAEQDAAAIQKLIAAGADPTQVAAATAAGGAPAAGGAGADGGGGTPVVIDQSSATGEVTSGFPTQPAGIAFPEIEPELLPDVAAPAVSVTIQPKPEDGVTVSGNAASVIEGTQDTEGGTSDTKIVNFVITLSDVFATDVEVTYVIVPGSALTPEDFMGELTGTVTIPAGQTTFIIPVEIVMDHFVEGDQNFTIVLTDAVGAAIDPNADTANVTIINDDAAPIARDDTNWAQEDGLVNPTTIGNVLENQEHVGAPSGTFSDIRDLDTNPQETLEVIAVNGAASNVGATIEGKYGTLVLNSDGSYTYTLNNELAVIQGLDDGDTLSDETFTYTIWDGYNLPGSDGSPGDASATLTITIFGSNDGPVARADTNWAKEDTDTTATGNVLQTLAHGGAPSGTFGDRADTDIDVEALTVTTTGNFVGTHGTLTLNADGSYTYTLNNGSAAVQGLDSGETLTDQFNYTASDGTATADATLTITIFGTNDRPQAEADTNWVLEDSEVNSTATGNVLQDVPHPGDPSVILAFADVADTDVDVEDLTVTTTGQFVGTYGTLTLNADGSYTYVLDNSLQAVQDLGGNQTLTDSFGYTATDGTASANATLTITIFGSNDGPQITVKTSGDIFASGAEAIVFESDLAVGSDPTGDGEFTSGQFRVSDSDGLQDIESVTINGETIPIGNLVGATIDGEHGVMTITAYNNGVASFTYELEDVTADVPNQPETDVFTLTTTDGESTSSPATVTINIVDDVPTVEVLPAVADGTPTTDTVVEDGANLSGTWTRDYGADTDATNNATGPATIKVTVAGDATVYDLGTGINTGKGTLTVNADGTWTFDPVSVAGTQNVVFTVTITDADGDVDSDTHTITITDGAPPQDAAAVNLTVQEADLPPTDSDSGTIDFTPGSDALVSMVFSGTVGAITGGYNDAAIVWSGAGTGTLSGTVTGEPGATIVLTLTGVNLATGNATVTATMSDEFKHVTGLGNNQFTINGIEVVVVDTDGDQAEGLVNVTVVDDVPTIDASNVAAPNIAGTYTGTYTFDVGADVQSFADSFEAGSLVWTNSDLRPGYALEYDAGASNSTQQVYHGTFNGGADTFFDIVVRSDGTYDFILVTPDPVTEVAVESILSGITGGSGLPSFTIPNSFFGGQFDVLLTGYSLGHAADTVTISSTELGVGDNVMHGNKDDVLRFDIQPIAPDVTVSSLTIHVATTAGWKATDTVDTIVHYTTGPDTIANIVWGADQQIVLNFDTTREVDWIEVEPHGTDAFKIDGVSLSYLVTEFPDNYNLDFQLTGDDKDGDSATAGFSVAVNTTDTSTYTIQGTSGADHLYGTTGNDILVGGTGVDSFHWNAGDGGAPAPVDTVTDFTQAPGDKLDLSELLVGEDANAGSLSAYLHFTAAGGNTTVEIKSTGAAGTVDQKIVLQGVDLTSGGSLNDSQIIQNLLTAGKLQTDA